MVAVECRDHKSIDDIILTFLHWGTEIEGIFNLLCSHLRKLDDAQKGTFLSAILAHIVSNENDPNAALRLKL